MHRARRTLLVVVVVAVALVAVAGSAVAAGPEPTGDRISLFAGDREYPAQAPFHIRHGHGLTLGQDEGIGRYLFTLEVDGVLQAPRHVETVIADGTLTRLWLFNYPDGMSGVHTLTGHWLAPCGRATQYLACGDNPPGTPVEFQAEQIVVTFTSS